MRDVKAIICDVYRTVLEVGEAPQDAEALEAPLPVHWANLRAFSRTALGSVSRNYLARSSGGSPTRNPLSGGQLALGDEPRLPELDALSRERLMRSCSTMRSFSVHFA